MAHGFSYEHIMDMTVPQIQLFINAGQRFDNLKMLNELTVISWPHMDKQQKKKLEKQLRPKQGRDIAELIQEGPENE